MFSVSSIHNIIDFVHIIPKLLFYRWNAKIDIYDDFDNIDIEKSCPLGENIIEQVAAEAISCKWVKLNKLNIPQKDWDPQFLETVRNT